MEMPVVNLSKWQLFPRVLVFFGFSFFIMHATVASSEPLTREQGDAILNELREIKALLARQASSERPPAIPQEKNTKIKFSIVPGNSASIGHVDAPVTMVAFMDFQCPFCKRFDSETFPEIKRRYIDTGKLRYIISNLPLEALHPDAFQAAEASLCAGDQNAFWAMHDKLMANNATLDSTSLGRYADGLGLNFESFSDCLHSKRYTSRVRHDLEQAKEFGITGTPSFVVGKTDSGFVTGVPIIGAQPFSLFDAKIREAMPQN